MTTRPTNTNASALGQALSQDQNHTRAQDRSVGGVICSYSCGSENGVIIVGEDLDFV